MLYREISAGVFASWSGEPINGVHHPLAIEQRWTDEDLEIVGLYRPAPADPVPPGMRIGDTTVERVDGVVKYVHTLEPIPLAERKAELLAALSAKRYQIETGGMVFNGLPVRTDRETSAILTAAYIKAREDEAFVVADWKIDDGVFITLDAASIIAVADAIRAHVQAAFTREAALTGEIMAAEDVEALDAIDLDAGW